MIKIDFLERFHDGTPAKQTPEPLPSVRPLCPREELNLDRLLRREASYPLNDEGEYLKDMNLETDSKFPSVYYKGCDFVNCKTDENDHEKIQEFLFPE